MTELATLIGNVGFPIVMSVFMMKEMTKMNQQHIKEVGDLNQLHKQEMDGMKTALENNTAAIMQLSKEIGRGRNES